jgi:hypothetical protein
MTIANIMEELPEFVTALRQDLICMFETTEAHST